MRWYAVHLRAESAGEARLQAGFGPAPIMTKACQCHNRPLPRRVKNSRRNCCQVRPRRYDRIGDGGHGGENRPGGSQSARARRHRHSRPCGCRSRVRRRSRGCGNPAARATGPSAAQHAPDRGRHASGPRRQTSGLVPACPAAGAVRLLSGRGDLRHLAPGDLPGRCPAVDTRRRRLRLGVLVGCPAGDPPRRSVGHKLPRGPRRHPTCLPHADAAAGPADDPGHASLRPERVLQPAVHRLPGPAVLRHVPGRPAAAAHWFRGDRRRRVLRAVLQPRLAELVPGEPGTRGVVTAADAGGGGPAAPHPRPPPGRHPRAGPRRGLAHRSGVVGAGGHPGGPGPDSLARAPARAGTAVPARPAPARRRVRRGRRPRRQPADHRHDLANGQRRGVDPALRHVPRLQRVRCWPDPDVRAITPAGRVRHVEPGGTVLPGPGRVGGDRLWADREPGRAGGAGDRVASARYPAS
jgi:hypothetical protein